MPRLTTAQALARLGWSSRSSLWRAERDGRIARAGRGPRGVVLWDCDDVDRLAGAAPAGPDVADDSGGISRRLFGHRELDDDEVFRLLEEQVAEGEKVMRELVARAPALEAECHHLCRALEASLDLGDLLGRGIRALVDPKARVPRLEGTRPIRLMALVIRHRLMALTEGGRDQATVEELEALLRLEEKIERLERRERRSSGPKASA